MAGQGSVIGSKFDQLSEIIKKVGSERIGVLFDVCHAFSAGYDIRTKHSFDQTMDELDKVIGFENIKGIHLSDSKGSNGSHIDRHKHIGEGEIGFEPFKWIMQTFSNIPKIIETPKSKEMDRRNLKILKKLI
jgi:deoxyribonuclease-4